MQDLVYDVLIFILFLGIIAAAISVFDTNINFVSVSATNKSQEISALADGSSGINTASSLYSAADVLAYANSKLDASKTFKLKIGGTEYTNQSDIRQRLKQHMDYSYQYDLENNIFTRKQ